MRPLARRAVFLAVGVDGLLASPDRLRYLLIVAVSGLVMEIVCMRRLKHTEREDTS